MTPKRLAIYAEADRKNDAIAAATGLGCPTGCGACCVRTPPHVSVSDVAPVARLLVAAGEGEAVLDRARAIGAGPCALFAPGQLPGGCTVYAARPVICRLFAFAAVRDKHGAPEVAICREHSAADPDVRAPTVGEGGEEGYPGGECQFGFDECLGANLPFELCLEEFNTCNGF